MQDESVIEIASIDEYGIDSSDHQLIETPRILLIDDDRSILSFVTEVLRRNPDYQIETMEGGRQVWETLLKLSPHQIPNLIICDWMMPGLSGVEICRRLKATAEYQLVYFILLTSYAEVQHRVEGLDAGADEFIAKPVDPEELQARVRAGLRLQALTYKLAQANRQLQARNELLESLSLTDQLTGVLNRRALDQALPYLVAQVGPRFSEARYRYLCLFMLDVDHFKQVNDTHGHYVGDCVLEAVAKRLQNQLRPSSLLYRYGGEEFVCITPGLNLSRSQRYAEVLRTTIANHPISISPKRAIPITLSIGGVLMTDTETVDADTLLKIADRSLYEAKEAGRNRTRLTSAGHFNF